MTSNIFQSYLGDCQNYGPLLGPYHNTGPNLGDPNGEHNFDNPPFEVPYTTTNLSPSSR